MQQRRINARGIMYRNGKILAVNQKTETNEAAKYWCLPGGGVDDYETVEDAVRREFMEETGIEPEIERLLLGQQFRSTRKGFNEELELFYLLKYTKEFENIDLSKTSHGLDEINEIRFVDPQEVMLLPEFLQTINLADYIENVRPVQIIDNFNENTI